MRHPLRIGPLALSLCMLTAATCPALAAAAPAKLNVLFIAVDDLNNRLGCYGDSIVKTPNIDRLAARGVRFDRAYCQYPLCNPSRTSFLSGRLPEVTQILGNGTPPRTHLGNIAFLPEHFRAAGYFTGKSGKIPHGAFDDAVKWDFTEHDLPAGDARAARAAKKAARKADDDGDAAAPGDLPASVAWKALNLEDGATVDGRTARTVVKLLEEHSGAPFFIAAGFHKPHRPYEAPRKYFGDYPADRMPLPQEPANVRDSAPPVAFNASAKEDQHLADPLKRNAIAAYHACIAFIDAEVGLLMDAMDRLNLWDTTLVVFASDHGYHLGEHGGMWRKMSLFEESARVPMILVVPGKKRGAICPRTVELLDLYPTLVELCGLATPPGLEGVSLVPLLDDPRQAHDRPALTVVKHGPVMGRSLRNERWRYTEWGEGKEGVELYDHDSDPHEFRNLADDPKHAATVAELKRILHARTASR
jgi:iduronate 2-sulfatase